MPIPVGSLASKLGSKHILSSPGSPSTDPSPAGPPPNKRHRTAGASTLRIKRAPINSAAKAAGFPEFPDGDVEIILPSGRRYVLHRAILSMNSRFFRSTLGGGNTEANNTTEKKGSKRVKSGDGQNRNDSSIKYRLRISGKGQELLQEVSSQDEDIPRENPSFNNLYSNSQDDLIDPPSSTCFSCGASLEDFTFGSVDRCPGCEQPHPSDSSGFDVYTQNAYENLFLIYYNFTPTYIYNSKTPSEQCFFRLVGLAQKYGSLRVVSTRLEHDLLALGDTLWLHIFWDSISWLNVSLQIRSQAIFKEATIHIIGRGQIISHLAKLQSIGIPPKVITIMQLKYNQIVRMGHVTERQLRALNYPGDPTPYTHNSRDSTNWLALSLFRSFDSDLSARLFGRDQAAILASVALPGLSAEYFRLYHMGGEAYLGESELHHFINQSVYFDRLEDSSVENSEYAEPGGASAASAFRRDIMMLKECARAIVDPICTNQSKIDTSELERRGGGYLTCLNWNDEELPWWNEEEVW